MKSTRPQSAAKFLILAVASAAFVLASPAALRAQGSGGSKAAPRRDLSGSERDIRALEIGSSPKREAKTIMAEVNEDFDRLRALNDALKKAASSDGPLDHKSLAETAAEIKKRATRLDANLSGLPKLTKDEKRQKPGAPADDAQARASLSSLNSLLTGFLTNPVFSDMGTLDAQLAVKARRDLAGIIELGEAIRKGAEKLGKR